MGNVDGLTVSRPRRGNQFTITELAELFKFAAIGVGQPQVVFATAITDKHQLFTVGRKAWLRGKVTAADNGLGDTTGDGQLIKITQELEHQILTVRGNVQRHPAAFIGLKGDGRWGLRVT